MDISNWLESDAPVSALGSGEVKDPELESEVADLFARVGVTREDVENKGPEVVPPVMRRADTPTTATGPTGVAAMFSEPSGMTGVADIFADIPALQNAPAEVMAALADAVMPVADIFANVGETPAVDAPTETPVVEWTEEETARRRVCIEDDFIRFRTLHDRFQGIDRRKKGIYAALETKIADILIDHAGQKKQLEITEALLRKSVAEFAEHTGIKTVNSYLSAKEVEEISIVDVAAATTWCEINYPAAINKEPDVTLLTKHLKALPKGAALPEWAEKSTVFVAQVSKKFEAAEETV